MSELFHKQVNAQKQKNFWGSHKPTKKCAMKMKKQTNKKRWHAHKNGRKHFIRRIQKTGENDFGKLQVNNSGHNEGTICLVNG